ncbi:hypothetical protein [Streptomyces sp. IB201691-2A2]|nr:hypothetical protein [Streptomyces sp. IB201691-2A2]
MPSVLGLMEQREARARWDLESWAEVLEQAQAEDVHGQSAFASGHPLP